MSDTTGNEAAAPLEPGQAGDSVHIHKPKAAHSLREFLAEISVIVVGILIAIGLEQVVETVHRDREVREAREALMDEIGQDAERLKLSIEEGGCQERQLDAYAAWARGGPKPPAYRTFLPLLRVGAWESEKSGAVPRMPLQERVALSAFYDQLNNQLKIRDKEGANNDLVASYAELPVLDREQQVGLLKAVALDRRTVHAGSGTASRLAELAATFGEPGRSITKLPPILRSGVDWVCGRNTADPYAGGRSVAGSASDIRPRAG